MAGVETNIDAVRIELEKILASPGFADNKRLSNFLEYVVRRHLEGEGDQVKEVVLGAEVFGRKPDYDPRQDSVVRTEAAKLRARLAEYYIAEGSSDPVVIEIPKGRYVPVVRFADAPASAAGSRRWVPALVGALLLLTVLGYWLARQPRRVAGPPEILSIAVLPFVNLTSDPENEYFSDGLTEELIDALTKVEGLRVPARSSAFAFKGKHEDIREIGSKLRVQMVLEGSVRKEGETVRVTAQLNKVSDGYHLWSQTYDRDMKSVLGIQNEIAHAIVTTLEVNLVDNGGASKPTADPEAHSLYLKGRYFHLKGLSVGESQRTAIAHFQQAIEKDPSYALAYAGLSDSWHHIWFYDPAPPPEALSNAEMAAKRALEIDETLSEAHASLANVRMANWDWQSAEREFQRAIALNPNNGKARIGYALCLGLTDRLDQGLQEAKRAQDLDLVSPEVYGWFGMLLHCARQYDQAIELSRKSLEMDERTLGALNQLGRSYTQKGMLAEAVAEFEKAEALGERRAHWAASLVGLYVKLGRRAEAEKLLDQWKARPVQEFGHALSMAMAYAGIGDKDEAFLWLERAYQRHSRGTPGIKISPEYDALRSDRRFDELLRKMGLQPSP